MQPIKSPWLFLAVFFLSLSAANAQSESQSAGANEANWRWELDAGQSVALVGSNGELWRFHYGSQHPKPFFHPLATTSGRVLTSNSPPDHPWHHGLWFSWKFVNDVNYWEPDNRQKNTYAGRSGVVSANVQTEENHQAKIDLRLNYIGPEDSLVMTEDRTIELSSPDANGQYSIDWTCKFTAADADVTLDRTPFSTTGQGQPWGGYAGLSCRFALDLTNREAGTAEGPASFEQDRSRPKSVAADYSGVIGDEVHGVAMLDHPDNVRYPNHWYIIRSHVMSYVNAALLTYDPLTIPAGDSIALRYRVVVHPGRWDAERLKEAAKVYLQDSEAKR